jgi:antirestriction protein ArdC
MPRRHLDARPAPRASLYDEVTARIVAQLEQGCVPWVQPWDSAALAGPSLPRNARSGRAYSGINILILWHAAVAGGYPSQGWLTFAQAVSAGGAVRRGERGTTVVFADRFVPGAERERAAREGDDARQVPFLKRFTLFNVAQCDGLPHDLAADPPPLPEAEVPPLTRALIAASGADFRIGGAQAFYAPGGDFVQVPPPCAFPDPVNWYRTALHELTHWTGHRKRLARDQSGAFGSAAYAREELAAEMGSAFLCAALGIVPTVRHADYIGAWLAVLRGDNRAIFRAAAAASKAASYLLALHEQAGAAALENPQAERIAA